MKLLVAFFPLFLVGQCFCQDPVADEQTFEERYARNIKKSRINGVYIPKDIEEAISEVVALSSQDALDKFKSGPEELVVKRLHFGLGRWIIYNWNLYEGSRFSHYLKEIGINHPDDQAKFVIVCLHRRLNNKPLNTEEQILEFQKTREKLRQDKIKVIKEEKRIRQNEVP